MRILCIAPVAIIGGAENVLLNIMASIGAARPSDVLRLIVPAEGPLAARARRQGFDVGIVSMPQRLAALGDSSINGSSWYRTLPLLVVRSLLALPAAFAYLLRFRTAVEAFQPDLIHSGGHKTHLLTYFLPQNRAVIIWHLHDFLGSRRAMKWALRLASRHCAGAIAVSLAVARDARQVLRGIPVRVVYNAIDVDQFAAAPDDPGVHLDLDALAGLPAPSRTTIRIGLVATYARWKGQDVVIDAAAHFFRRQPGAAVRFYIIGGPIYTTSGSQFSEAQLRRRVDELGLSDFIGFVNFQENIRAVYHALDIVVHASVTPEPFGLTIVEAMASSRPVIVSQAGGAAELFTHEVDAIGVTPNDPAGLATALMGLVDNPARRDTLARCGRQTAVSRFCLSRFARELLATYDDFSVRAGNDVYGDWETKHGGGNVAPTSSAI